MKFNELKKTKLNEIKLFILLYLTFLNKLN